MARQNDTTGTREHLAEKLQAVGRQTQSWGQGNARRSRVEAGAIGQEILVMAARGAGCIGHARGMGGVGRRWVLARGVGRCLRALCVRLCRAVEPTERRAEAGVGAAFERACAEGRGCWREAVGSGGCGGVGEGGLGPAGGARGGGRGRGEGGRRA